MDMDHERIVQAIEDAPAWAKIALTVPQERLRDDAYRELARHVVERLTGVVDHRDQLALPIDG